MNPKKYILTVVTLIFLSSIFMYKKFFGKPYVISIPPMISINLDTPPEERWTPFINSVSKNRLLTFCKLNKTLQEKIPAPLRELLPQLEKTSLMPEEYKRELRGIEQALSKKFGYPIVSYEDLLTLNLTYTLFVSCSAGIITDSEGTPYLFRNLDWPIASLRSTTINITWIKNGKKLFKSTGWPFFVGVLTGQRCNDFAIALNARHDEKNLPIDNVHFAIKNPQAWSVIALIRHALQYATDYQEAYRLFENTKTSSPAYVLLAGTKKDEGIIFERDRETTRIKDTLKQWQQYYPECHTHTNPENSRSPWTLDSTHAQHPYIAITNIDSDYPAFQDLSWACKTGICKPLLTEKKIRSTGPRYRRNSVLNSCCMLKEFTIEDLFNVLWTQPVLNYQTLYSTVMCPAKNIFRSYGIQLKN